MLPQSHLSVVTRNITWAGPGEWTTEPQEVGWAREAIFFIRALKPPRWPEGPLEAQVQVSPDGIHWADLGREMRLPAREGEMTFLPVRHFGGWLRLAVTLPAEAEITVLVSLHLKA